MTLLAGLGYVFVAVAVFQSAHCDEQGDANPTNCTMEYREGEILSPNATMYFKLEQCFYLIGYEHMGPNPSDELIRSTFAAMCNKTAILSECLDDVDTEAIECLDANELRRHRLYRQYKEMEFGVGCEDDEAIMADVHRFHQDKGNITENFLVTCEARAVAELGAMDVDGVNRFTLYKYRVMRKVAECLGAHKGGERDVIANWAITYSNKVTEAMRCVNGEGGDMLCKTIA